MHVDIVRKKIDQDKSLAKEVINYTKKEMGSMTEYTLNDFGHPNPQISGLLAFRGEKLQALKNMLTTPFFANVEIEDKDQNERLNYLITKNRVSPVLGEGNWCILSWTSPITATLLDSYTGKNIEYEAPKGIRHMKILSLGQYGTVLPSISDTTYQLKEGDFYIKNEQDFSIIESGLIKNDEVISVLPTQKPPSEEYVASEDFGLDEIIELADCDQRQTMHLPFHDTLIIEGPPGSGKTSIGIMRIPCLIDRQWQELGIDISQNEPFHNEKTMLVLVQSNEMVHYLSNLTKSLGIISVRVRSIKDFLRNICRECHVLAGQETDESHELSSLKTMPNIFKFFWGSFVKYVKQYWLEKKDDIKKRLVDNYDNALEKLIQGLNSKQKKDRYYNFLYNNRKEHLNSNGLGLSLYLTLDNWCNSLQIGKFESLALRIRNWQTQVSRYKNDWSQFVNKDKLIPDLHYSDYSEEKKDNPIYNMVKGNDRELKARLKIFAASFFNRQGIVDYLKKYGSISEFKSEFQKTGLSEDDFSNSIKEWDTQIMSRKWSEHDLSLMAFLGLKTMLLPARNTPVSERLVLGSFRERLTHIVVDEDQDFSYPQAHLFQEFIDEKGTLTFCGDLHQRVHSKGFFNNWTDLKLRNTKRVVLAKNFRQTKQLGCFVKELYNILFQKYPDWSETDKLIGPEPRLIPYLDDLDNTKKICEEVRYWIQKVSGARIALLWFSEFKDITRLDIVAKEIEAKLDDLLITVEIFNSTRSDNFGKGNIVLASAQQIKGLEFDIVICLDLNEDLKPNLEDLDITIKNAIYVVLSRPQYGLSMILNPNTEFYSKLKPKKEIIEIL